MEFLSSIFMSDATENAGHFPSNVRNAKHSVVANEYTRNCRRQFRSIIIAFSITIFIFIIAGIAKVGSTNEIALGEEFKSKSMDSVRDGASSLDIREDWYIDNETIILRDEIKELKGNLIINSTGNLTLDNVTLIFECTSDGEYHIEVRGKLYAYNSNITSSPKEPKKYCFWSGSYSTIVLENTTISYCGYKSGEVKVLGLYISALDCHIKNCTFVNNWCALYLAAGEPKIENSVILNNEWGIITKPPRYSVAPYLANNTIISNRFGIHCERDYSVIINNTIAEIEDEEKPVIELVHSYYTYLKDNRIDANGKYVAIKCSDNSNIAVLNNTITNASLYAISIFSSRCELLENKILNTSVGVYCEVSNLTAENNTITNTSSTAIYHLTSTGRIVYNNITFAPLGIHMRYGKAALENNTFNATDVQVLQEWELKVYVKAWNGAAFQPVIGANVSVKNVSGIEKLNLTTDPDGYAIGTVAEYEIVNNTTTIYTPYTIRAYKYYVGEMLESVEIIKNWEVALELKIADLLGEKLEITGIRSEGEILTVKVNITNKGGLTASNVLVKFLCDNEVFKEELITVYYGASTLVAPQWNCSKGAHEIKIEIDPENRIEESDETNNVITTTVYINFKPIPSFNVDLRTVKTYEDVVFNASISYDLDGKVKWYFFDFDDGTNSDWINSPVITHNYTLKGIYYPKLKVKDNFSVESDLFTGANITVSNRPPIASITASKSEAYTYEEIIFYATGSYDGEEFNETLYGEVGHRIIKYYWDFGDNSSSVTTDFIVSHSYTDNGNYTVTLIVQDDDFDNSTVKTFSVRILNRIPKASFTVTLKIASVNDKLQFNASFTEDLDGEIINYTWDFGDGSKGFGNLSEHSYTKTGIYRVVLTVFDDDGSNSTYEMYVDIKPLPTWIELHYKEVYLVGAIFCILGAIFFSLRWYEKAKRKEKEVKLWAEKKGAEKEIKIEEEVEEWAEKKKKLKTIDERIKEWAKRREAEKKAKEEKVEKGLDEWAAKKEAKKKK